jgi:LysM repeat protein
MTRQQAVFVIGVNAVISLVISLVVLWLVGPRVAQPAALPHAMPTVLPATNAASLSQDRPGSQAGAALTPTPIVHVVQAGDTVLWLAGMYNVAPEAIIAANSLEDPDVLAVGQPLVIPALEPEPTVEAVEAPTEAVVETEAPVETPTASRVPTKAGPSPTPTPTPIEEYHLEITQLVARGRQEAEVLVLTNYGVDVRLQGWTLSNDLGKVYTFPNLKLYTQNRVRIYTTKGRNTASDLYWGLESAAWGPEVEVATLKDPEGKVQAIKDLR